MAESKLNIIDVPADRALFSGQFGALVVSVYENERPPCGLLGLLDWHFLGVVSQMIRSGAISGRPGECTYLPVQKGARGFRLLLVGAGPAKSPGVRTFIAPETLSSLRKNLISLRINQVGLSRSDFGNPSAESLSTHFKGVPLWLTP